MNEVAELRMAVARLQETLLGKPEDVEQTKDSFSYQWAEITEGASLLGDAEFEAALPQTVGTYADLVPESLKGKKVLDAGCGIGRFTCAFVQLGADVTAIDQSAAALAHVRSMLPPPNPSLHQHDLLKPLPVQKEFDLVWCYGVAHHTGNTRRAVENVAAAVRPGGRLVLMIYGTPRTREEFVEVNTYTRLRRETHGMSYAEKQAHLSKLFPPDEVHGYFDAVSPAINDLHRFDEVAGWLRHLGFTNVRRTCDGRNHHVAADLPE